MRKVKTYGRRIARKISPLQKELLESLLPQVLYVGGQTKDKSSLFSKTVLEIGFGNGDSLVESVLQDPDTLYIGAESYLNGVALLLRKLPKPIPSNVRIYSGDGLILLQDLADQTLDQIQLLFPDPWRKTQHYKRRIINQENLQLFARKLKKDGKLIVATDHVNYASWIDRHLESCSQFNNIERTEPQGWIKTNYQKKAEAENRKIHFFIALAI